MAEGSRLEPEGSQAAYRINDLGNPDAAMGGVESSRRGEALDHTPPHSENLFPCCRNWDWVARFTAAVQSLFPVEAAAKPASRIAAVGPTRAAPAQRGGTATLERAAPTDALIISPNLLA